MTNPTTPQAPSDVELHMHAFRLMRSGNYARLGEVRKAMLEDFPQEPAERIDAAIKGVALRLLGGSND